MADKKYFRIQPLNKFRLLKTWSKLFKITEDTVIAYGNCIYTNKDLHKDVLVHELVHLEQQKKYGLSTFTKKYLTDKNFRLQVEKEAYIAQLNSIKENGLRKAVLEDCVEALTSGLYGTISELEARALITPKIKKSTLDVNKLI